MKTHAYEPGLYLFGKSGSHLGDFQVITNIDTLHPSGIVVYGPASDAIFSVAKEASIPVFQYDAFMTRRYKKRKSGGEL